MIIPEVVNANIVNLDVDAIVNAANKTLLGGGGVDGVIHRAAGPQLAEECALLGGCAVGDAKLTRGFDLPAKYVIHTVGPIWRGGKANECELLAKCYQSSLDLAVLNNIRSIAFPAISTGAYAFPIERATKIAVSATVSFLNGCEELDRVIFCCMGVRTEKIYRRALRAVS